MFFFALGIATVYFDFFTYPMSALTMPLTLVLLMEEYEWKKALKQVILLSIFWGIGYLGMWGAKWILCFLVLHDNIFEEVLLRIAYHTGDVEIMGEKLSAFGVLWKNIEVFVQMPYLFLAAVIGVGIIIKYRKVRKIAEWVNVIPLFAVSAIPMVWILVTKSHAGWCYWYTSRGFMGAVFALCGAFVYLMQGKDGTV